MLSLAEKNARSDGTPLYIVSVLSEFWEGKIRVGDIENLPEDVVKLWKERISRLDRDEMNILYCLKLLKMIYAPPFKEIVSGMWKNIFEKSKADLFSVIESLEKKLWLKDKKDTYSSFDVQLEAVEIKKDMFEYMFKEFEKFVKSNELEQKYRSLIFFNLSYYYSERSKKSKTREELSFNLKSSIEYIEEAIVVYKELGLEADVATSLNNASNCYSDLAKLEETREARKDKLDKAVEYIEEAIRIRRELGLKADMAVSLNNASNCYSDLAALEETKEGRKELLDKAIGYIEEAIRIRRELGLKADVAMSLNNASNRYFDLAALEETREGKKDKLDKAVKYIEEAFVVYKELGLKADVAMSLNNASSYYSGLAALEETKEGKKDKLDKAVKYIEEAIEIRRELGLKAGIADSLAISVFVFNEYIALDAEYLIKAAENCDEAIKIFLALGIVRKAKPLKPYGIQLQEKLFEIDGEDRHRQVIEFYKSI